jgi:hypothetical protein
MFSIGDVVQWYSQAGGSTTLKTGTVVKSVPPGQDIDELLDELETEADYNMTKLRGDHGARRPRFSYLVAVQVTGNARPIVYWPVPERLRPAENLDYVS